MTPNRVKSHIVGDIAVNAVMSVVTQCGWACEVVHKDYGEDIMIQPDLAGKLDPWRLWIQVKGTEHILPLGREQNYRIYVPIALARRWILGGDPTIIVLWQTNNNVGHWTYGPLLDRITQAIERKRKNIAIEFNKDHIFDEAQLHEIVWGARLSHFDTEISRAQVEADLYGKEDSNLELQTGLLCMEFMRFIGILEKDQYRLSDEFWNFLWAEVIPRYEISQQEENLLLGIGMSAFLQWVGSMTECGIPGPLLINCGRSLATILRITLPKSISKVKENS